MRNKAKVGEQDLAGGWVKLGGLGGIQTVEWRKCKDKNLSSNKVEKHFYQE